MTAGSVHADSRWARVPIASALTCCRSGGQRRQCAKLHRFIALGVLLVMIAPRVLFAETPTPAWVIWAEPGSDYSEIRLARTADGEAGDTQWLPSESLSDGEHLDVAPCIAVSDTGRMWAVWTRLISVDESVLVTRVFDGNAWSAVRELNTVTRANTGPVFAMPADGVPWLFWAGYDGSDDEMYVSRWQSTGVWSTPERLVKNNSTPDVQALAGLNEAQAPFLTWFGFNGDEYVRYVSEYRGGDWTERKALEEDGEFLKALNARMTQLPSPPVEVGEPAGACIAMLDGSSVNVIPWRFAMQALQGTRLEQQQ